MSVTGRHHAPEHGEPLVAIAPCVGHNFDDHQVAHQWVCDTDNLTGERFWFCWRERDSA